jgi:hypothetical protein
MPLAVVAAGILWGSVTVGPTTPVCRAGTPCSKPAKRTTLTFSRASRVVTAKTDAAGRYRVQLPTGTWSVRLGIGMQRTPATVVVRAGTHRVDFSVDTGIR